MDWYELVFELIDMRSFSNLWYWIALAVAWSTVSHWVLGVPHDMIQRGRRHGGEAMQDVEDLVRINVNRILYIDRTAGLWLLALGSGLLTMLALLGFVYDVEFAQAVFLIAFPMSVVGALRLRTARAIARSSLHGEELCRRILRHRFWTQVIGLSAIVVTALYGMWRNMAVGPLGG